MSGEELKVLVVDDEEPVRNLLKKMLDAAGYESVTAANGTDALDIIAKQHIDAVLLDIKMPGLSGMDVLAKLTYDYPNLSVIMVTGVGDTQTAVDAMKKGASDYITKPFDRKDLVSKLRKALEQKALNIQREQFQSELQQSLLDQSHQMMAQFDELVRSLAREHTLLYGLTKKQAGNTKEAFSKLPPELQKPMSSVEEFRDALIRILQRGKI